MKCSSCGNTMTYDVASYGLVCDHCGAKRQLHKPDEGVSVGEMDFESALRGAGTNWGVSRRLVTCKSCGASMLFAPEQMSELCPFCGSAIVLTPEEADCGIAPNAMIPFSITKEEVTEKFYRWNKFAFWSPEKFRKGKVLGNLTPIYIPYWTFDADVVITYSGRFGYTTGSGEDEKTNWYQKSGIVEKHLDDHTVCGSRKFANDKLLNSVTSFRESDLIAYTPDALAGMPAEMYTIGLDEAWKNAQNKEMGKWITNACCAANGADCYSDLKYSVEYHNLAYRYVLVPVWLTGCRYGGKIYNVAASGYNGTGNCNRPLSVAKLVTLLAFVMACFILGMFIPYVNMLPALLVPAGIIAFMIYLAFFMNAMREQRAQEAAKKDPEQ